MSPLSTKGLFPLLFCIEPPATVVVVLLLLYCVPGAVGSPCFFAYIRAPPSIYYLNSLIVSDLALPVSLKVGTGGPAIPEKLLLDKRAAKRLLSPATLLFWVPCLAVI